MNGEEAAKMSEAFAKMHSDPMRPIKWPATYDFSLCVALVNSATVIIDVYERSTLKVDLGPLYEAAKAFLLPILKESKDGWPIGMTMGMDLAAGNDQSASRMISQAELEQMLGLRKHLDPGAPDVVVDRHGKEIANSRGESLKVGAHPQQCGACGSFKDVQAAYTLTPGGGQERVWRCSDCRDRSY